MRMTPEGVGARVLFPGSSLPGRVASHSDTEPARSGAQ